MLTPAQPSTSAHPEVVEDFVRNFLVEMGMNRTAGSFQAEWYVCGGIICPLGQRIGAGVKWRGLDRSLSSVHSGTNLLRQGS